MIWLFHMDQHRQFWQKNDRWNGMRWWILQHNSAPSTWLWHAAILGDKTNCTHSIATVFSTPHILWLLALSYTKNGDSSTIPWEAFHECIQVWKNCWCVCVCVRRTDELHGQLEWKALHFKYLNFKAEFQELFDMPVNIQPFTEVRCQPSQQL